MPRRDFTKRSPQTEWLEVNGHSAELPAYLGDLAWLNRVALGPWAIKRWLNRATRCMSAAGRLSLLDVGCGDGDVLRGIARWAARRGMEVDLAGIDLAPDTIAIARARTRGIENIQLETADVFTFTPAQPFDFVISSLLAHHLDDERIVALLRWTEANARRGWLIYDLRRSAVAYHSLGLFGALAKLHPMVVHDGRISVQRALTRAEWRDRIGAAGLTPAQAGIERFLYRVLVSRLR